MDAFFRDQANLISQMPEKLQALSEGGPGEVRVGSICTGRALIGRFGSAGSGWGVCDMVVDSINQALNRYGESPESIPKAS